MTNITVTRNYTDANGVPQSGTVKFTPVVSAPDGGSIQFLADTITASVSAGALSISLITTNSFIVTGTVTYRVVENVGTFKRRYYVALPSSLGSTVDLSTLTTTAAPPNTVIFQGGADVSAQLTALTSRVTALEGATTVAVHAAAADPHPVYLTAAEGAAAYPPITAAVPVGGTTGQALVKSGSADYALAWSTISTTISPPVVFTGTAPASVVLVINGAAAQTADVFDVKDNGGNILFGVLPGGQLRVGTGPPSAGTLRLQHQSAAEKGIVIKQQASGTGTPLEVQDSSGTVKFSVGTDGSITSPSVGAKVIVLDNAAAVPAGTTAGTVILRRP